LRILLDENGRISTREVDVDSDGYQVARTIHDQAGERRFRGTEEHVARLALIGNMKTDEFVEKFKYLIN
jgi:hypothetical protein